MNLEKLKFWKKASKPKYDPRPADWEWLQEQEKKEQEQRDAKQAEWDALPPERKAARIEYKLLQGMCRGSYEEKLRDAFYWAMEQPSLEYSQRQLLRQISSNPYQLPQHNLPSGIFDRPYF